MNMPKAGLVPPFHPPLSARGLGGIVRGTAGEGGPAAPAVVEAAAARVMTPPSNLRVRLLVKLSVPIGPPSLQKTVINAADQSGLAYQPEFDLNPPRSYSRATKKQYSGAPRTAPRRLGMRRALLSFVTLFLVACGGSKPVDKGAPPPAATGSSTGTVGAATSPRTPAAGEDIPLALTEDRLQNYITFRHELHTAMRSFMQDLGKAGKHADSKSSDVGKTATAFQDLAEAGQRHEGELKALREKYGFTDSEDNRIWAAITAVLGAKSSENPMLQDAIKMFRGMQKQSGPAKKAADDYFAEMEQNDKKQMEEATRKFGADAVGVLAKHVKDLHELQMDAMKSAFGGGASPAAKR
jgi:hypothetical protein